MTLDEHNAVPQQRTWEHFPHAADIGVRGFGNTPAGAFEQAARALTAVVADLDSVQARHVVEIRCESTDPELLLFDWLNALIYDMAVRHMLFSRFDVRIDSQHLEARAWGENLDLCMANYYFSCIISHLIGLAAYSSLPTLFPYMDWAAGTVTMNSCQLQELLSHCS